MNAAVLAFCNLAADGPAIIDLVPISAEIEPAGIGILRDDAVRGADIPGLVQFVMPGHGEFENVDFVALDDVFQDRPVIDPSRRQQFRAPHPLVVHLDDVYLATVFQRQPKRQRDAANRREVSVEGAEPFRISRNVVEQYGGRVTPALFGEHMGDGAHLGVPMSAANPQ